MAHSVNKVLQHTRQNYLGQQYHNDVISRMEFLIILAQHQKYQAGMLWHVLQAK